MSGEKPPLKPHVGELGTVAVTAAEPKGPPSTYIAKQAENPKLRISTDGVHSARP